MTETRRWRSPRILDLFGLVVGYGMAALLVRSFWPRDKPLVGVPAIALGLEYVWLGLAMSGPIVLLLDRRGKSAPSRPKRPRLGRLISSKEPVEPSAVGRGPAGAEAPESGPYTRAELAWMLIGGYWIALTMLVVPTLSVREVVGVGGLIQVVAGLTMIVFVAPRKVKAGPSADAWTHAAALGLLGTWPIAWALLILLSGSV